MIRIIRQGAYKLIETRKHVKVLYLDNDIYAWPLTKQYGEMLVTSHRDHKTDALLSTGRYNLYSVDDEDYLTDLQHLELETGLNRWQGYLLMNGLPDSHKTRCKIVPTSETITGTRKFMDRKEVKKTLALT